MDDLTFMDLAVLERIDENTVVEKFGPVINSSFFDAANILGGVKTKGLVDFRSKFPGPSEVFITEQGQQVAAMANEKSALELDELDHAVLKNIASGYKDETRLAGKLNVRKTDLAYRLNKLVKQNYISYSFKSGRIDFSLTEAGFKEAGYKPEEAAKAAAEEGTAGAPAPKPARAPSKPVKVAGETPQGIDDLMRSEHGLDFGEASPEEGPVKLDEETKRKAKLEYYKGDIIKWIIIILVVGAIGVAAAVWYFFLR